MPPGSVSPGMKNASPPSNPSVTSATARYGISSPSPSNIRENVRRTFSVGSAQNLPLSAQSLSTIAALQQSKSNEQHQHQQQQQQQQQQFLGGSGGMAPGGMSASRSSPGSGSKTGVAKSGPATSYAAALKLGSGFQDFEDDVMLSAESNENEVGLGMGLTMRGNAGSGSPMSSLFDQPVPSIRLGMIGSSSGSSGISGGGGGMKTSPPKDNGGGSNSEFQSLMKYNQQLGGIDLSRPNRSYSEPIISYEGYLNSHLGADPQQMDIGIYSLTGAVRQQSSNDSSRSSSFYLPHTSSSSSAKYVMEESLPGSNLLSQSPSMSRLSAPENLAGKYSSQTIHSSKQSPSLAGISCSWLSTPPPPVNPLDSSPGFLHLQLPPAVGGAAHDSGNGNGNGSGSSGKSAGGIASFEEGHGELDVDSFFGPLASAGSYRSSANNSVHERSGGGGGLGSSSSSKVYNSPLSAQLEQSSSSSTTSPFYNAMDGLVGEDTSLSRQMQQFHSRQQQMQQLSPPPAEPLFHQNGVPTIDTWNSMFLHAPHATPPPHPMNPFDAQSQWFANFGQSPPPPPPPQQQQQQSTSQHGQDGHGSYLQEEPSEGGRGGGHGRLSFNDILLDPFTNQNQLNPPLPPPLPLPHPHPPLPPHPQQIFGTSIDGFHPRQQHDGNSQSLLLRYSSNGSADGANINVHSVSGSDNLRRPAEFTETDELFKFKDLNLDAGVHNNLNNFHLSGGGEFLASDWLPSSARR